MYGRAIKHRRKQAGLSQSELGDKLGVTHTTISRYERGIRQPSPKVLHRIADVLDTEVEELRHLDDELREEGSSRDEPDASGNGVYVATRSDISRWRSAVIRDRGLDDMTELLLLALPEFLDKSNWVATVTIEQFARETNRNPEITESHWPEMIASPYVERLGEVEWVLRLTFP